MVLSNKKLKQKLRSVLSESLAKSESQANQPNLNDSQSHQSFKSLLNSVTLKPKLSKREIRRVKIPSIQPTTDHENGVVEIETEAGDGELKKNNKRKREKDGVKDNDLSEKKSSKKKKKKKIKKKKVVKKDEEGLQIASAGSEEPAVTEELQIQPQTQTQIQTQISKEDENICTKIYVGGIPYYSTVDDIQSFFEGCGSITEIDCLKFPETGKFNGIAMISFRTEAAAKRALALDGSDMGGLSLKVQPYKATRDKKVFDFAPAMLDGYNRIYVGNLSWNMTEDELKKFFSDCNISSVRLSKDKETGEFKGFAHVDFADNLSLTIALKFDQKPLFGRPVRVRCAVPPKSVNPGSKVDPTISKNGSDDMASKGKRQTCYDCGEKGHLSSMCPNKKAADVALTSGKTSDVAFDDDVARKGKRQTCYECGEKGHLSSSCPNKKAADVAHMVNRTDDVAIDDMEGGNVGDGKMKRRTCYECGEKGHLSSLCPNKKGADVAHTYNRTDNVAFEKDEMEVDNVGDSKVKRRSCYECGEKGHLSSSCPNKQGADMAYPRLETFAHVAVKDNEEIDFNTANVVSDGKLKRRTCYECGERGHLSSLCPKKQAADVANTRSETFAHVAVKNNEEVDFNTFNSVSDGKLRRRTCYECGERGHLSSLCPKKQAADVANLVKESDDMEVEKADAAVVGKEVSEGKLRRRTCYECGERGHLSLLCPKKQTADVASLSKEGVDVAVEKVETMAAVSDGKLKRRNCYECGLKGHVSSLCPNKQQTGSAA